jgi:hypothetical protein
MFSATIVQLGSGKSGKIQHARANGGADEDA